MISVDEVKKIARPSCIELSEEEKEQYAKEFNTIAVDDGIAMGHDGMLYSLPRHRI